MKEVEGQETANLIIGDCKEIEDTLDNDTKYLGALTRSRNVLKEKTTRCEKGCKKDKCNVCITQACNVENKVHRLTRKVINFLNEGRTNNPCFSVYQPKVPLQLSEDYYEKLIGDEYLGFETVLRLISYGLIRTISRLTKEEMVDLKGENGSFVLTYEAFNKVVMKSCFLSKVKTILLLTMK